MISAFTGEHAWLSNFWCEPFPVASMPGLYANSAEHAFQASKSTDRRERLMVLNAPTPGEAKRRGRQVTLRPEWEQAKRAVMLDVLLAKFALPHLAERLAATRNHILIEGNHWGDAYWGAVREGQRGWTTALPWWHEPGEASDDVLVGYNWLGRLLMMTREVIS